MEALVILLELAFLFGTLFFAVQWLRDPSGPFEPLIIMLATLAAGFPAARRVFRLVRARTELRWQRRGRELFRGLGEPGYLQWQQAALEVLYEGLDIVSVYGRRYPAALIRASPSWTYPFGTLCKLAELRPTPLVLSADQRTYRRLLGTSVKWPQMKGFALKRLGLDEEGRAHMIEATTTRFIHNLATAHILEWELHKVYLNRPRGVPPHGGADLLRALPRRAAYHGERSGRLAILEPTNAFPLIGLQAMVVFRDRSAQSKSQWRIVTARRSDDVVVKPGFFQFHPAGGFEVYGAESDEDDDLVKDAFDVRRALFREYAEELFDAKHLQARPDSRDPTSVLLDPDVQYLVGLIESNKATVDCLGVVVDLQVLRHELSFLIVISDDGFRKRPVLGSWEARQIRTVEPDELQSLLANGQLHAGSAGLLQLAIESERWREIV